MLQSPPYDGGNLEEVAAMHSWYLSSVRLSWEKLLEMKDEIAQSHVLTREERSWAPHDREGDLTRAAYDYDMFNLFFVHPD